MVCPGRPGDRFGAMLALITCDWTHSLVGSDAWRLWACRMEVSIALQNVHVGLCPMERTGYHSLTDSPLQRRTRSLTAPNSLHLAHSFCWLLVGSADSSSHGRLDSARAVHQKPPKALLQPLRISSGRSITSFAPRSQTTPRMTSKRCTAKWP